MNYIHIIFADSNLLISFWSEFLKFVAYFQNQTSMKHLEKTSYETLFDEKSDFNNFRIIDYQAWILIFKEKHSKFDFKFSDCKLLEYAASTQYILYEMNSD